MPRIARSALFGVFFIAAIVILLLSSIFSLSRNPDQTDLAYPLLQFNLIIIVFLAAYLGYWVWATLFAQRVARSAPLLHRRFVIIFSLAALIPAVTVGAFSTHFISQNISDLFGANIKNNMEQAREILDAYVDEEFNELGKDVRSVQAELNRRSRELSSRISYTADLQIISRVRELDAVYILRKDGYVLTRVERPDAPEFELPRQAVFEGLETGDVAFQKRDELDYLIGLSKLAAYDDAYLYIGQLLRSDNQVLSSISGISDATNSIDLFNDDQSLMGQIFLLTMIETALLVLIASVWLGLAVANRIIDPLSRLIDAAERVRSGDMSAKVDVQGDWGEMSDLGSAFNRMTRQLTSQRDELVREHDVSEQRRQFSEAVLSGVRAGVIGLAEEGRITLMNESAKRLLGAGNDMFLGYPLQDVLSEFLPAFNKARESISGTAEDQVQFYTGETSKNFDIRVSNYHGARKDTGWVVTFDDMTRLVAAQRHSAWREVARRIAHEIKNPLTPIQLSAERLARKYSKEIKTDPEVFENCTQTIIRQVASLEQMVNEFSAFARRPAPSFETANIRKLLDEVLFAQGVAFPEIEFDFIDGDNSDLMVNIDTRLLSQALANIYKNAGESITRRVHEAGLDRSDGVITTELVSKFDQLSIYVTDNGSGWPVADKERLLEPYVTTRDSGTGLGLAIVMRIAEDHGGNLYLHNRSDQRSGATVEFTLPVDFKIAKNQEILDEI